MQVAETQGPKAKSQKLKAKSYGLVSVCKKLEVEGGRMVAAITHDEGLSFPEFSHQASSL